MSDVGARAPRRGLAVLGLATVVAATFFEALASGRVFFQRDIQAYWYPNMAVARRALAEGSWPLWNPYMGFGAPLLADASFQLAYPPTWLVFALPLDVYYKVFAVGHCLFAGLGARALARRLGLGALAAGVAGATFALSGPLLSTVNLFHHYAGAAWIPWVLFALEGLLRRPGLATALGLGLAAGGQILAGSGDMCLASAVAGLARIGWYALHARPSAARLGTLAGTGLLGASLAGAVGGLQVLPTAERAVEGSRLGLSFADCTYWSLHPALLADLVIPRLVGDLPVSAASREVLFEGRQPLLACLYLGMGTLVLLALALVPPDRRTLLAGAGLVFFLLASLGRHTPLYAWLLEVPGFALMRYPQKHLLPAALFAALLAGAGAERWARPWSTAERRRARRLAAVLLLVAAGGALGLLWLRSAPPSLAAVLESAESAASAARTAALKAARSVSLLTAFGLLLWGRAAREQATTALTALLLTLTAADLVSVGQAINPLAPAELLNRRPSLVDSLLPRAGESRIWAPAERAECLDVPPGPDAARNSVRAFQETLRPPAGARWGLFGSFDGEFTGLGTPRAIPLTDAAWTLRSTPSGLKLLQTANVGHVLLLGAEPIAGLEHVGTQATPCLCPLQVLRVTDPLPRAYVVRGERPLAESADALAALLDSGFDPRREVLLSEARTGVAAADPDGRARIVARTTDSLDVDAMLAAPGVLVVVEAFDHGWRATVDGRPAPVLRANSLFRAVRLPEGRHRVRFDYRPWSARAGLALSLAGALGAVSLGLLSTRRAERTAGQKVSAHGR
jgi:hypothetical protein